MTAIPLGPFTLHEVIGRGGMAQVWHGVHAQSGVPVGVKVMTGGWTHDVDYNAFFREEVHAVAGLDHPGIVHVFDHGSVDKAAERASEGALPAESPYLVMELASATLRAVKGLEWARVRTILLAALEALAHAHSKGVIHRDVKSSNLLIFLRQGDPVLKLADFGLAFAFDRQGQWSNPEAVSGTPWYMAPEQLQGHWRDYGPWTDLYGVGCLGFEVVTGRPAFSAETALPRDPPVLEPTGAVPRGFEGWLRRLLQNDPRARFQRAADAAHALSALADPERSGRTPFVWLADQPTTADMTQERTRAALSPAKDASAASPGDAAHEALSPRRPSAFPADWRARGDEESARFPHLPGAGLGLFGLRSIALAGRIAERDALWDVLRDVHANRHARLLMLHGPPGQGKTRLADWVADRGHEVGAVNVMKAFHGFPPGSGEGLPRMVARFLRCVDMPVEELRARLQRILSAQGCDDPGERDGLTALISSDTGGSGPAQSPAERHALILRLFRRLSRKRPLAVLLDDAQWGPDSLDFALSLLEEDAALPVPALLILTVNDEALAERPVESEKVLRLMSSSRSSALLVPPLAAADHAALVGQLLDLDPDLARQVLARTAGNPLFAVHLVGDWVQRGVLRPGPNGFVLDPGVTIARDLQEVWAARLSRILEGEGPDARRSVEIGAALGQWVKQGEWEAACAAARCSAPETLLDKLVTSRLARRVQGGWTLSHGMLREGLERASREAGRWAPLNEACAAMLGKRFARGERGVAERMGWHLVQAGRPEAALAPLLQGAREKRETSEYPAARSLLELREQALGAARCGAADVRSGEGWLLQARIALHEGDMEEASRRAAQAERAAAEQDWPGIRSEALRLLGDVVRRQGDLPRAAELYARCVALAQGDADRHARAASLWGLGDVARQRGDAAGALELFARSRALYDAIGDGHGIGDFWIGAADVAWQRGEIEEADRSYRQALAAFEGLGNRYGVARAWNGLGEVARAGGRLEAADERYRKALSILQLIHSREEVFPRLNLGLVELARDRPEEARGWLTPALNEAARMGWRTVQVAAQAALLIVSADRRDWAAWDAGLETMTGILRGQPFLEPDVEWAARRAGDVAAACGQPGRARSAYRLAWQQAAGLGQAPEIMALEALLLG